MFPDDLAHPSFDDHDISERMSGNLCRCSAYPNIIDAIREVVGRQPSDRTAEAKVAGMAKEGAGMKIFAYAKAETPLAAVRDIANTGAKYIAGGTNLLALMKLQVETPSKLVDISRLDLTCIRDSSDGGLIIEALTPNSDLADHPKVKHYEVLSRALLARASARLRNKASTAGNLLQGRVATTFMICLPLQQKAARHSWSRLMPSPPHGGADRNSAVCCSRTDVVGRLLLGRTEIARKRTS